MPRCRPLMLLPLVAICAPAAAATPREILVDAAFSARDKAAAESAVEAARTLAESELARAPGNREAQLQRALAIGYRAKLRKSRTDALASRKIFEDLAAANPRDAEVQLAIAGWHLNAIDDLGGMMARTALGARKSVGDAALARAVALGGAHAGYSAMAGMSIIRADPQALAAARPLLEQSAATPAPTPFDRAMQRGAQIVLASVRSGDGARAAAQARRLLPFGQVPGK